MAKVSNTGKIIIGLSALAVIVGSYIYFKKPAPKVEMEPEKQPDSATSTESNKITPPPTLPSTNPTGTTATNPLPANQTAGGAVTNVYSTANGAIVYKANVKADGSATVGAKVRNANKGETVGKFIGNRDISGYTFLLAKDINSGQPVLISKSVSKTAL